MTEILTIIKPNEWKAFRTGGFAKFGFEDCGVCFRRGDVHIWKHNEIKAYEKPLDEQIVDLKANGLIEKIELR